MSHPLPRRTFLQAALLGSAATALAQGPEPARFPLIGFTKPFQHFDPEQTAETVAAIGWGGVELPVRAKGQVEPARVAEDLPKVHAALKQRGLDLTLITTGIRRVDAEAEAVLRTAASLGVKRYRLAFVMYDLAKPILPQLAEWKRELRDLAALNRQLGIVGGLQNHSGAAYIGGPLWDYYELVHDVDPEFLGVCFDIGHATLEGGLSWPVQARLLEPFFKCVYVKDFRWEKTEKGWKDVWVPLGEGMVRRDFFKWLRTTSYRGPISQHSEYLKVSGPAEVEIIRKDRQTLQSCLGA